MNKKNGKAEHQYQVFKAACDNNHGELSRPLLYAKIAKELGWYYKNKLYEDEFQGRYRRETGKWIY
ncbi:hypothetical protein [Weissella paramesenteroides]|uniref:Uncharacterized protein n=1 Tax=Weissella paramesenteroides ATCC 33313 TaxID=585506 RepID=C5R818_WEIPA|nr:hypothetical protein [Weissella paramesenteroides]EER75602.1 hypothetical protein HMPREF0877_0113 [Weissella paramesenteroides ATCC 33313]